MLKFKNEKINDLVKRSIIAIVMLLFIFPILFATYYGNEIGKIIGFVAFAFVLVYSVYEIIQHFQMSKISKTILSLIPLYIYLLPTNIFEPLVNNKQIDSFLLVNLITRELRDYNVWIGLVAATIICLLEFKKNNKKETILNIIIAITVIYLATNFFKLLWILNIFNVYLVLFLGFVAAFSDVFGYLVGKSIGRKLFNFSIKISPNKSMEGFLSSFIFSAIFVLLVVLLGDTILPKTSNTSTFKIVLVFVLPIISIVGDLFFSFIKRMLNIKDFSKIIKNHGGLFDRFDSTSFVFLFFSIILISI